MGSSTDKGCSCAQACFENLSHRHLVVSSSTAAVLVDPHFRDQFLITAPSARYAAVLECVPEEFVGGASRLTALVEFLSGATMLLQITHRVSPPFKVPDEHAMSIKLYAVVLCGAQPIALLHADTLQTPLENSF